MSEEGRNNKYTHPLFSCLSLVSLAHLFPCPPLLIRLSFVFPCFITVAAVVQGALALLWALVGHGVAPYILLCHIPTTAISRTGAATAAASVCTARPVLSSTATLRLLLLNDDAAAVAAAGRRLPQVLRCVCVCRAQADGERERGGGCETGLGV